MKRLILVMVSMSAVLGSAMAGPLDDAQAAYSRGDREATLHILAAQSREDPRAVQSLLGQIFPPCTDDLAGYSEVVALFRKDADRGNSRAQFNLGNAYFFGSGVPKDHAEAVKWYRLAAEQGEAGAQYNLGYMYENGKGVPQDPVQANVWLRLYAEGVAAR